MSELTQVAEGVFVRPMLTISDAVDFVCSGGLAAKTRDDYRRLLHRFADDFPRSFDVAKVTEEDCVRFFNGSRHLAKGTQAWQETVLSSFFKKLYFARKIKQNPMEFVPRTRRPDPDSLDLKTVSSREVALMLEATRTWPERLCLAILVYLGPRRGAVARLRLSDYREGRLRFHEKGGKTIWKKVPPELAALIEAARKDGAFLAAPNDYLVPPVGPLKEGKTIRDDRCIWRLVKGVAYRAGVDAHTHALRAAFADFVLDSGGDSKGLQELMGHKNPATTERYTRRYDRERRMAEITDNLSWAAVIADNKLLDGNPQFAGKTLGESGLMGAGGFEPPQDEPQGAVRAGSLRSLADDLKPQKKGVVRA